MISSSGPSNAKIFLLGDYPSETELTSNVALDGVVKGNLSQLLKEHGVLFDECYRSICIKKDFPELSLIRSRNKTKKTTGYKFFQNNPHENLLIKELATIRPKVIVPIGELALRYTTGEHGIYDFRGSSLPLSFTLAAQADLKSTYVLPIVHPRDYFSDNSQRFIGSFDLGKAVNLSKTIYFNPLDKYQVWVCRSYTDLIGFFTRWKDAEYWTFDIELHNGFITCISFCGGPLEAISVPFLDQKIPASETGMMINEITRFFASPRKKLNQNVIFDWLYCEAWGFDINGIFDDTMVLAHTIYSELPKSLGFLTSVHTDIPYYKDEGKEFDPRKHSKDQLYLYNAKDAIATWIAYDSMRKDAKEMKLWDFHVKGPQKFIPIYKKMAQQGMRVDEECRKKKIDKYEIILSETSGRIADIIGRADFNPLSPKQCVELVYNDLKCPPYYRRNEDGLKVLTTEEDALEEIILNYGDELGNQAVDILQSIVKSRKVDRILGFLEALIDIDGVARQSPKLTGTENGRTSASKSIFHRNVIGKSYQLERSKRGTGYSFQTIPKHGFRLPSGEVLGNDITEIYVPAAGYCFVAGDLSQAEARVVAVLAKDWDLLKAFDTRDIHKDTASWIYMCKPEDIKKPSFERDLGKMTRHAGNLDMQPATLALRAHISVRFAKQVMGRFHTNAPNVQGVFHYGIRQIVTATRTLNSPHGRQRFFFGKLDDDLNREAYSFIPQATITDHMKFTMVSISNDMLAANIEPEFIYENHDGIMAHQKLENAERFMDSFQKHAHKPINFQNCSMARDIEIVIPAELEFSTTNWKGLKDWSKWGK